MGGTSVHLSVGFLKPNRIARVWALCIGLSADRYADRSLLGGIVDRRYFRPITIRNRPVTVDFDRCRPLPGGISLAAVREKEKEREEEGEPRVPIRRRAPSMILIRRHPPSSNATDEGKPRRCHLLFSLSPYTRRRPAIGSKSYNTLVAELVAFETKRSEGDSRGEEEDCVDFAAATAATLGVPSPNLSRGRSFDDHQVPDPDDQRKGKGDIQEEEELMRVLNLSKAEVSNPVSASILSVSGLNDSSLGLDANYKRSCAGNCADTFGEQARDDCNKSNHSDSFASQECNASTDFKGVVFAEDDSVLSNVVAGNDTCQTDHEGSVIYDISNKSEEIDMVMPNQATHFQSPDNGGSDRYCSYKDLMIVSANDESISKACSGDTCNSQIHENSTDRLDKASPYNLQSSNGIEELSNVSEVVTSCPGGEPIYEGEECILESGLPIYADREPVYEGEMVLAEQAEQTEDNRHPANTSDEVAHKHCKTISGPY
ncbi:hypothetical protein GW17_00024738 [Ensete ventricosum]|nr:hypothetical protein GW17_00024738 [Ensete ventricosum]